MSAITVITFYTKATLVSQGRAPVQLLLQAHVLSLQATLDEALAHFLEAERVCKCLCALCVLSPYVCCPMLDLHPRFEFRLLAFALHALFTSVCVCVCVYVCVPACACVCASAPGFYRPNMLRIVETLLALKRTEEAKGWMTKLLATTPGADDGEDVPGRLDAARKKLHM